VRDHWQSADFLMRENADFERAIHVLDQGQFMRFSDVALVSLWGAIELLFSPSPAELRFRVSALLAAYLEGAGEARLILQKEIVKLYDARSAAAHGRPDFDTNGLLDTFELLRRVIIKIINDGHVPSKDELESRLFGDSWEKVLN